jgi:alkylhydroperoxidase family enzyme
MPARIAPLAGPDVDAEAQAMFRDAFPRAARFLTDVPDAPPLSPILGLLAHHPTLAAGWLRHNGVLLDHGVLDPRARELLVLAVARRTGTTYLWHEHVAIGRSAGVSDDELRRLERGSRDGWSELDVTLLRAVDELVDDFVIADATWRALADRFDEQSLLELLFVVGTYTALAMVTNSVGLVPTDCPR